MHAECRIIPDRALFLYANTAARSISSAMQACRISLGISACSAIEISTSTFLIKFLIIFSAAADDKWQAAANAKKSFLRKLLFLPFNAKAVSSVSVDTMFTGSMSYAGDNINSCEPGAVSSNEKFYKCISEFPTRKEKTMRIKNSAISNPFCEDHRSMTLAHRS